MLLKYSNFISFGKILSKSVWYLQLVIITIVILLLIGCGKPPKINAPTGPSDGPINEVLSFSVVAEDPDNDEIQVHFDWGDGKISAWTSLKPSGSTFSDTHTFTTEGKKLISAQSKDSKGKTSNWSEYKVFFATSSEWSIRRQFIELDEDGESASFVSTPAIADNGTIYVGCSFGHFHAIDSTGAGKSYFIHPDESEFISSPAIGPDGSVYVGSEDSILAFNPNLSLKWRFVTDGEIISSPAIGADGSIYILSDDGYLYAISNQGQELWRYLVSGGYCSPAIDLAGRIYIGGDDGFFYCLNNDGTLKWQFNAEGAVYASPALDNNNNVYLGNEDGKIFCVDTAGSEVWRYLAEEQPISSIVLDNDGNIYFSNEVGALYCLNSAGNNRWFFFTGGSYSSTPAVRQDGAIYFRVSFDDDDSLYAVTSAGDRLWAASIGTPDVEPIPSPTIAPNGTVYISGGDAFYGLVGSNGGSANSSWPMFRHDARHTGRLGGKALIAEYRNLKSKGRI